MNYSEEELRSFGLKFGENVCIHNSVQLFNAQNIKIGSNVRIDCFCLISAGEPIVIGNFVHIAAGAYLYGGYGIDIEDYCGISGRVSLYTASDDYSKGYLSNPTIDDKYKNIRKGKITVSKHVLIGAGSVVMPGVTIGIGASIGALSFVNKSVPEFVIAAGNPLIKLGLRNKEKLFEMEAAHKDEIERTNNCKT